MIRFYFNRKIDNLDAVPFFLEGAILLPLSY